MLSKGNGLGIPFEAFEHCIFLSHGLYKWYWILSMEKLIKVTFDNVTLEDFSYQYHVLWSCCLGYCF